MKYILAPLRGVTVRTFRIVFADALISEGVSECVAPFIPAIAPKVNRKGLKDVDPADEPIPCIPQAIGKDPAALRALLEAFKTLGHNKADLNAGCPYPMITRKSRGAGLLKHPALLEQMLQTGIETMGAGNFSLKVRLGLDRPDELEALLPIINRFPLANLTVHARTAKQMYSGSVDLPQFVKIAKASCNRVVYNGDFNPRNPFPPSDFFADSGIDAIMVGRAAVGNLALRADATELLMQYLAASEVELCGRSSVLGRMKELLKYWRTASPLWNRRWEKIKFCRTTAELKSALTR